MTSGTTRRVDQWLWFARFFKSRTRATQFCLTGRLRINATPIAKAHHELKVGDVLTFFAGGRVRVVRVRALGSRRGPAAEARELYQELDLSSAPDADHRKRGPASNLKEFGAEKNGGHRANPYETSMETAVLRTTPRAKNPKV